MRTEELRLIVCSALRAALTGLLGFSFGRRADGFVQAPDPVETTTAVLRCRTPGRPVHLMPSTMRAWEYLLCPEVRQFEPSRQAGALKAAAATGFDAIEYVGLAVTLAATVLLTRCSAAAMGLADRFGAAIANFIVAVPLLLVLAGPFYIHRARRGLRAPSKSNRTPTDLGLRASLFVMRTSRCTR